MRTDRSKTLDRRRQAIDRHAATAHERAARSHEAASKFHSEAVTFFRRFDQPERADRDSRLVAAHLAGASRERKLAAFYWAAAHGAGEREAGEQEAGEVGGERVKVGLHHGSQPA
jgi:hypothetical protein